MDGGAIGDRGGEKRVIDDAEAQRGSRGDAGGRTGGRNERAMAMALAQAPEIGHCNAMAAEPRRTASLIHGYAR